MTGGPCYFEGDPSMIRREVIEAWINANHDDEVLWSMCAEVYREKLGENPLGESPKP